VTVKVEKDGDEEGAGKEAIATHSSYMKGF
jgi:hypothetical protein